MSIIHNIDKIKLFTMIEADNNNINNNTSNISTPRLYESEAIKCIEHWRKNGGQIKDIDIICYCPSRNTPSQKTISKLRELNVMYIENFHKESELYPFGFFLVPIIGYELECMYEDDTVLIHIDLDMYLIKELDVELFSNDILIGQYDIESAKTQRSLPGWGLPLDTGFIISKVSTAFYRLFKDMLLHLFENKNYMLEADWICQNNRSDIYFLEEYVVDKIFNLKMMDINTITKYQLGEGYAHVNTFSNEELKNVYFWHEHLITTGEYNNNKIKQKIEFFKRLKNNDVA